GYLRGAAMVLVDLLRQDRNPGIRDSTNLSTAHYRSGSTIVVNALQERYEPLQRAAMALGSELGCRVQMNIYLTPPGSRGFLPHYDTHDVFIAQVHGSKAWRLAGAPHELPMANVPHDKTKTAPETTQEFELCCGDLLYLPRGTFHSGAANQTASLHVTIGLHPVLWASAIQDELTRIVGQDVRFRRALPVGFARDEAVRAVVQAGFAELLDALREQMSPEAMTADSVNRLTSMGLPPLRHHLQDLEDLPFVGTDTPARRRPGVRWRLTVEDGVAGLHFHNKTVRFPAAVADEVRFVAEQADGWFTGEAIPGELDQPGRKTLVRTLVSEGFLTLR
ncbi:cupin domain-containing protein, partial [Streptomyces sp. NPDC006654]|uniref:cupin domain-containing protein n=1 Tax=Streptomyces sp. NPDC006654 TaxID=3156897 RepID=UPI0034022F8A